MRESHGEPRHTMMTPELYGWNDSVFNCYLLGQNGRHFRRRHFRCIFMNKKICISIRISLKFVPKGPIDNKSALFGTKPLPEPMLTQFTDIHIRHLGEMSYVHSLNASLEESCHNSNVYTSKYTTSYTVNNTWYIYTSRWEVYFESFVPPAHQQVFMINVQHC